MDPLFEAVVGATEEAIITALVVSNTVQGRKGNTAWRITDPNLPTTIPPLLQVMQDYNRLNTTPSNQPAAIANSRRSPPKPTQKPNRKKKGK